MEGDGVENDTRGWIMCVVSAIACVSGASIICVDILLRYVFPRSNFKINESETFKASSFSLSFGIMLFSALYSILPSSKKYLIHGGFAPKTAAWILLAGFTGGFIVIQVVSRFAHSHMPSHVENCVHSHADVEHGPSRTSSTVSYNRHRRPSTRERHPNGKASESTPLISPENGNSRKHSPHRVISPFGADGSSHSRHASSHRGGRRQESKKQAGRKPSMIEVPQRLLSFVKDTKTNCDSFGPCFGYSDPCGNECRRHVVKPSEDSHRTSLVRASTGNLHTYQCHIPEEIGIERTAYQSSHIPPNAPLRSVSQPALTARAPSIETIEEAAESSDDDELEDIEAQHHHHVAEKPYASLSLQTSIAITLHKLPEGFMTFATNHANPDLGLSVFLALFVHNIVEGFVLALPIYLDTGSRLKAMFWALVIGGVSQPLGAGAAALWFKIAGADHQPGSEAYGIMFAITAGIMTGVAMTLFVDAMSMNHSRNLCLAWAFVGMFIIGASNALTS